jgi:hypothetical protein
MQTTTPDTGRRLAQVSLAVGAGSLVLDAGVWLVAGYLHLWYAFPFLSAVRSLALPGALVAVGTGVVTRQHRAGKAGLILGLVHLGVVALLVIGLVAATIWASLHGQPMPLP